MKKLFITIVAALSMAQAVAYEIPYSFVDAPRYWVLDKGRTSVRMRQQPTTNSPLLKSLDIERDDDYTECLLFWDGDKSAKYKPFGPTGDNHKTGTVSTAYVLNDELMPLVKTSGEWSQVVYTRGYWGGNPDVSSKEAWVKSEFGHAIEPTTITSADITTLVGGKLNSRSSHPDFKWRLVVKGEDMYIAAPFMLDSKHVVLCTVPVEGGKDIYYETPTWHQEEDGMYARTIGAILCCRLNERNPAKIAAFFQQWLDSLDDEQYEEMMKQCTENARIAVWVKNKLDGKMYVLPEGIGDGFKYYKEGRLNVK